MLISFVVPVHNSKDYLNECLESIRLQTERDFEVIVIDDGSTDGSTDIINDYCEIDSQFKSYRTYNQGPMLARRVGVKIASGDYIVCLDSDDKLRIDTVETLKNIIVSHLPDIVNFGITYNDKKWSIDYLTLNSGNYFDEKYSYVKHNICMGESVNVCAKAIKRKLFDLDSDYSQYVGMRYAEDWFQLLPIIDAASSCCSIDQALYYYRQSPTSSMHTFRLGDLRDFEYCMNRLYEYQNKWGESYRSDFNRALIVHNYALLSRCILAKAVKHDIEETIAFVGRIEKKYRYLHETQMEHNKSWILSYKSLVLSSAARRKNWTVSQLVHLYDLVSTLKSKVNSTVFHCHCR